MSTPPSVHIGIQGAKAFIQAFMDLGGVDRNPFLMAGQHAYKASGVAEVLDPLWRDIPVTRFSDFSPNPTVEELQRALAAFGESGARSILAVGGGSALDMAKLVNYFSSTQVAPEAYVRGERGVAREFLPLLAVPTTAGSGSEATHFAVLYDGVHKLSVASPALVPSHTWLNAAFTESLSPYQTACSGFDALAQAMESYWALGATTESRENSEKALILCLTHLEGAVLAPSPENRAGMQMAAHWAGRAINVSKTTAAHALSYAMTGHYGLAHGHAVALVLPAVLEANASVDNLDMSHPPGAEPLRKTLRRLYELLGVSSALDAATQLRSLMARIGLSSTWFTDQGVDPAAVRALILQEVNQERLANNPCRFTQELMEQVLAPIQ